MSSNSKYGDGFTEAELIEALQSFADNLNRTPTAQEVKDASELPTSTTYQKHFGSWNNAVREAGLPTRGYGGRRRETGREYLKRLKDWAECHECGESRNDLIVFHHIGDVSFRLNSDAYNRSASSILQEARKCIPLCPNCHRLHHHPDGEFNANQLVIPDYPLPRTT